MLSCTRRQLLGGLRAAAEVESWISSNAWLRRYRFHEAWKPGVQMATYENGSGDDVFVFASDAGVVIKGFDHESCVSPYEREDHVPWPGLLEGLPPALMALMDHPEVRRDDATFVHWLVDEQVGWRRGPVRFAAGEDDGAAWLLAELPVTAQRDIAGARGYWGKDAQTVDAERIRRLFADCQA
jgi:hypothetical protein